ncbi:MAG: hypothetical protein WC495_04590 [Patescibacteria group bacterium]
MNNPPKGLIPIVIVIVIAIIATGLVGTAWYYQEHKGELKSNSASNTSNTNISGNQAVEDTSSKGLPLLAFIDSGNIYSLNSNSGDINFLMNLYPRTISNFDISENDKYLAFTQKIGNTENSINLYNFESSKYTTFPFVKNTYYDDVIISPDNTKLAYLKKMLDESSGLYLDQAIYVSNIDGTNEKRVVALTLTKDEIKSYFDESDPCAFSKDVNMINVSQWSPENDYLVYSLTDNYECSGPGSMGIKIADLSGGDTFFETYFPDVGTYTFNDEKRAWLPWEIDWPSFVKENGKFLLMQHASIPIGNNRRVVVDNGKVELELYYSGPDAPDYVNEVQQVKYSYDYGFGNIAWEEWTNYSGSRANEPRTNEVIVVRKSDGARLQLQEHSDSWAYTNPIILSQDAVLFRKYQIKQVTNDSGYTYDTKSDTYDLIERNIETGDEKVLKENVNFSNYKLFYSIANSVKADSPEATKYEDTQNGFSVEIPKGWHRRDNNWSRDFTKMGSVRFGISKEAISNLGENIDSQDDFINTITDLDINDIPRQKGWVKRNNLDMYQVIESAEGEAGKVIKYYYFNGDSVCLLWQGPYDPITKDTQDFESVVNSFGIITHENT